jgi:alkanesulfonate monooxygenase SsuD/methylene tetrahydromethanopterin reductase-like flavin-dependent oxidoreductase (luciferase family)
MLPTPVQVPHPPIWAGGNSRRAIRRAVDLCDGWIPFPTTGIDPGRVRTAAIETLDDLKERVAYAREYSAEVGRTRPLDICFVPFGFSMRDLREVDPARFRATVEELAGLGVTWLTLALPAKCRAEYCERVKRFGDKVLAKL